MIFIVTCLDALDCFCFEYLIYFCFDFHLFFSLNLNNFDFCLLTGAQNFFQIILFAHESLISLIS